MWIEGNVGVSTEGSEAKILKQLFTMTCDVQSELFYKKNIILLNNQAGKKGRFSPITMILVTVGPCAGDYQICTICQRNVMSHP